MLLNKIRQQYSTAYQLLKISQLGTQHYVTVNHQYKRPSIDETAVYKYQKIDTELRQLLPGLLMKTHDIIGDKSREFTIGNWTFNSINEIEYMYKLLKNLRQEKLLFIAVKNNVHEPLKSYIYLDIAKNTLFIISADNHKTLCRDLLFYDTGTGRIFYTFDQIIHMVKNNTVVL
jgi:hypothetical protein